MSLFAVLNNFIKNLTTFVLQPICHVPERFGENRLGGLGDIVCKKETN